MKVAEITNREIIILKPGDSIRKATQQMSKGCAGSLLVVDDQGAMLSVLTDTDFDGVSRGGILANESTHPASPRTVADD